MSLVISRRLARIAVTALVTTVFSAGAAAIEINVTPSPFAPGAGYGHESSESGGTMLDVVFALTSSQQLVKFDSPGDIRTFNLGTVQLREDIVGGQERDQLNVVATFDFDGAVPGLQTVTGTGVADAGIVGDPGVDFVLSWAPVIVDFGNGGSFRLAMSTMSFTGAGSLIQTATMELLTLPAQTTLAERATVPEPAGLALVGIGLLAGLAASRKRKSQ